MTQVEVIGPTIGRDRNRLLESGNRAGDVALPVENLADAVQRLGIVRLDLQRLLELIPGLLEVPGQEGRGRGARGVEERTWGRNVGTGGPRRRRRRRRTGRVSSP